MANFRLYLAALWEHWTIQMTSGVIAVFLLLFSLTGWSLRPSVLLTTAFVGLVLASYRAWHKERGKIEAIEARRKPRLIVSRGPFVERVGLARGEAWFLYLDFSNEPFERVHEASATKVVARLSFYGIDGAEWRIPSGRMGLEIYGRWADTEQPAVRGPLAPTRDLDAVDFEPNGRHHTLDVVMKFPNDNRCYASTNQHFCDYFPEYRINLEDFCVRVKLAGENHDSDWWLVVRSNGTTSAPTAELRDHPPFMGG